MVPAHPNNPGIRVTEEDLKDPKKLKDLEEDAKKAVDALNSGMSKNLDFDKIPKVSKR